MQVKTNTVLPEQEIILPDQLNNTELENTTNILTIKENYELNKSSLDVQDIKQECTNNLGYNEDLQYKENCFDTIREEINVNKEDESKIELNFVELSKEDIKSNEESKVGENFKENDIEIEEKLLINDCSIIELPADTSLQMECDKNQGDESDTLCEKMSDTENTVIDGECSFKSKNIQDGHELSIEKNFSDDSDTTNQMDR